MGSNYSYPLYNLNNQGPFFHLHVVESLYLLNEAKVCDPHMTYTTDTQVNLSSFLHFICPTIACSRQVATMIKLVLGVAIDLVRPWKN